MDTGLKGDTVSFKEFGHVEREAHGMEKDVMIWKMSARRRGKTNNDMVRQSIQHK